MPSNISLNGIMALSDWASGKREENRQAALAGQKAQTGYETQATDLMGQRQKEEATTFGQQQDQLNETNMWKDVLTDPGSPMAAWHFATDANGNANNPWVAKHIPQGYVPVREKDDQGRYGVALKHYQTGDYLPADFHSGSDDGHGYKPAVPGEAPGGGTDEGVPAQSAQGQKFFLDSDKLTAIGAHVFGKPEVHTTGFGARLFGWDPATGKYGKIGEGMTGAERGPTGGGAGAKDSRYSSAIALMNQRLLPQYGDRGDPTNRTYDPAYDEYINLVNDKVSSAIEGDEKGALSINKIVMDATQKARQEIEKKKPGFFEDARLSPKERAAKMLLGPQNPPAGGATPTTGTPPATKAAVETQEPQSLDEMLAQAGREKALKSKTDTEGKLLKSKARVNAYMDKVGRKRLLELAQGLGGMGRDKIVDQIMREASEGFNDPESGFRPGALPDPVDQEILRRQLLDIVSPKPNPKPGKVAAETPPTKTGAAKGGVVAPMRGMEPGTGIPGTISRPLQIRAGGFRPRY